MEEGAAEPCAAWRRWDAGRVWGVVLPALATLPAIRATIRVAQVGWAPLADEGIIALRAHDVLSARTPVLGQLSLASTSAGAPTRSPGPLGYWVLSPAARIGPLWLIAALAGVLAAVALAAVVHEAGRRGGVALMLPVAVGVVLSARGFDPVNLATGWNPSIGLAPMALLVLLAWSVGVGDRGRFPALVVAAAFVTQVHAAHLLPALGAVAVALVGGWGPDAARWWRARRHRDPDPDPGTGVGPPLRPLAVGAVVGLVLWAPPLAQQLFGDRGNLTLLIRSAGGETQGIGFAGKALAAMVGVPPAFTRGPTGGLPLLARLDPAWWSATVLSTVALVVALAVLVAVGVRRRSRDIAVPPLLVLAVLAGAVWTLRATPTDVRAFSVAYTTWWLIPVGMLAWVVLVATAVRSVPRVGASARRLTTARPGLAVLVPAVVAAGTVAVALGTPIHDPEAHLYPVVEEIGDAVVAEVRPGQRYHVLEHGPLGLQLAPGLAYRIRRAGADPVIVGFDGTSAGPAYVQDGRRCAAVIGFEPVEPGRPVPAPAPGAEVLRVVPVPPGPVLTADRIAVTWAPDDGEPSC